MLLELKIKNYALIKDLTLELREGFNILTGETGAGKSIIIGALQALLGEGKLKEKTAGENIYLEAIFKVDKKKVISLLTQEQFSENNITDTIITLSREYSSKKGNIYRINGKIASAVLIKEITENLIDILGQQGSQTLTKNNLQIDLLDSFCGKEALKLREEIAIKYKKFKELEKEINYLKEQEKEIMQKLDLYNFQVKEIENANLADENEEEKLTQNLQVMRNQEKINSSLNNSLSFIEEENGIENLSAKTLKELSNISQLNENLQQVYSYFLEISEKLREAKREIKSLLQQLSFSEKDFEKSENRIYLIKNLKKKYGSTIKDILNYYQKILSEVKYIANPEENLKKKIFKKENFLKELKTLSEKLSGLRKKQAEILSKKIITELQFLSMPRANFNVLAEDKKENNQYVYSATGINKIEFLFTANPGIPLLPLAKIASGGELSRVALAVKSVLSEVDDVHTLIFDEVDAGLGGEAAFQVAKKLSLLAKNHQVICITHLPTIACFADNHFSVSKESDNSQTLLTVKKLTQNEKENELARMLRGKEISKTVIQNSKELLQLAKKEKNKS